MSRRHTKPEPTQIRSALAKVLTAPSFAASARLSRLLRFIVEQTLSGRAHELKEYTLGVDVFDRGEKFAPKIDRSSVSRPESSGRNCSSTTKDRARKMRS